MIFVCLFRYKDLILLEYHSLLLLQVSRSYTCPVSITFTDNTLSVDTQNVDQFNSEVAAAISLPQSILNVTNNDDINLAFTIYTQAALFPLRESTDTTAGGTVVGSSVVGAAVGGITDGTSLPDPVTVVLMLNTEIEVSACLVSTDDFFIIEHYKSSVCLLELHSCRY